MHMTSCMSYTLQYVLSVEYLRLVSLHAMHKSVCNQVNNPDIFQEVHSPWKEKLFKDSRLAKYCTSATYLQLQDAHRLSNVMLQLQHTTPTESK